MRKLLEFIQAFVVFVVLFYAMTYFWGDTPHKHIKAILYGIFGIFLNEVSIFINKDRL